MDELNNTSKKFTLIETSNYSDFSKENIVEIKVEGALQNTKQIGADISAKFKIPDNLVVKKGV